MMEEDQRFTKFSFWLGLTRLVLLGLFVWQIRFELRGFATGIWMFFNNGFALQHQLVTSFLALLEWLIVFITSYVIFIFWLAQFILPVTSWQDRLPAAWRLFLFSIWKRLHGAAVFVHDGQIDAPIAELDKNGPGVAFVDLRSAITLDRHLGSKHDLTPGRLEVPQKVHFNPKTKTYVSTIRVAGPGLIFTRKNEKIAAAVDLRTQTRARPGVLADTRDGIRIKTDISCTFTLGEPPDVLDVCLGAKGSGQIFVIEWDDSVPLQYKRIKSLSATELDAEDQKEIYDFAINHPDPSKLLTDLHSTGFPYTFDQKRVEQAIYFETSVQNSAGTHELQFKKWWDWPQDVATEKFRILLAQWPYVKLYSPEDPVNFPMRDLRKELSRQVRNTGVLAYRVVALLNKTNFEVGKRYSTSDMIYYPPRNLIGFAVLRDRGIKVLSAGFGDLEPLEKTVGNHFVDVWRSVKQKEADLKVADNNLEIARTKNQARIRAQQNMIYHLTQVLENQQYSREALALLIYQELEAAAANPETRKLLPEDTLSLLTGIGTILLPRDKNSKGIEGGMPILENDQ